MDGDKMHRYYCKKDMEFGLALSYLEPLNKKLGKQRGVVVKQFMLEKGIPENRVRIISQGKLNAVAPITDIVGMQKDRNAQFMIAEVKEVKIPTPGALEENDAKPIEECKYLVEEEQEVASQIKVAEKEYVVQRGDTLSKIAKKQLGSSHRWKYLYALNKDKIKNPNKLRAGQKIIIPVE